MEEARTTIEAKHHCCVRCKGWGYHCSFCPQVPTPASMGTREGSRRSRLTRPTAAIASSAPPHLGNMLAPISASAPSFLGSLLAPSPSQLPPT